MSPALLSQRLKQLEQAGVISRTRVRGEPGLYEYQLTKSGRDLQPLIEAIGVWGQRWVETKATLHNADPQLLMWDMRRNLRLSPLPTHRQTIQFIFPEVARPHGTWWLLAAPHAEVDLCSIDPGYEVDLCVFSDLKTMTAIWMGLETVHRAVRDSRVRFSGDRKLATSMQGWLGLSPFAKERKLAA